MYMWGLLVMVKKLIITIILILGIVLPLRELYIDFRIKRYTEFNLKAFIMALILFLMLMVSVNLLFGGFIRWLME